MERSEGGGGKRRWCWPCLVARTVVWVAVTVAFAFLVLPYLGVEEARSKLLVVAILVVAITAVDLGFIAPRSSKPSA